MVSSAAPRNVRCRATAARPAGPVALFVLLGVLAGLAAPAAAIAPPFPGRVAPPPRSGAGTSLAPGYVRAALGTSTVPLAGTIEVLALLCDFQREVPDDPLTTGDGTFTSTTAEIAAQMALVSGYYREASYGKFNLAITLSPRIYRVPQRMAFYGAGNDGTGDALNLLRDTLAAAAPDAINFGRFQAFYLVHAGLGQESDVARGTGDTPDDIYSAFHGPVAPPGHPEIGAFVCIPEREDQDGNVANSPLGIWSHEFGHVLGLPDLYDTDNSSSGVGNWCLMGFGPWLDDGKHPAMFCGWSRAQVGWLTPTVVSPDAKFVDVARIADSGTLLKMHAIDASTPARAKEYFLIENRRKVLADAFLRGEGLLIWHVDENVGGIPANAMFASDLHPYIDLVSGEGLDGSGKDHLNYNGSARDPATGQPYSLGTDRDPFFAGVAPSGKAGSTRFGPDTVPSSRAYDGTRGPVDLTVLSGPADVMRFQIGQPVVPPPPVPVASTIDIAVVRDVFAMPNPTPGPTARIRYTLGFAAGSSRITIFDRDGRSVHAADAPGVRGPNDYLWDLRDRSGAPVRNGVYVVRLESEFEGRTVRGLSRIAVKR